MPPWHGRAHAVISVICPASSATSWAQPSAAEAEGSRETADPGADHRAPWPQPIGRYSEASPGSSTPVAPAALNRMSCPLLFSSCWCRRGHNSPCRPPMWPSCRGHHEKWPNGNPTLAQLRPAVVAPRSMGHVRWYPVLDGWPGRALAHSRPRRLGALGGLVARRHPSGLRGPATARFERGPAATGAELARPLRQNRLGTVAWSPDGARLASGAVDGTLLVWGATNGSASMDPCLGREHRRSTTRRTAVWPLARPSGDVVSPRTLTASAAVLP